MNTGEFELFFEDPSDYREPQGEFGILYLLRRDINTCIESQTSIWLSAMGIFAGIDLLAKFYQGDDNAGKSGRRFKGFLNKYCNLRGGLKGGEITAVYQLRNAMMHSFGLYSEVRTKASTVEHRFCLVAGPTDSNPLIKASRRTKAARYHVIDVTVLHGRFETAVTSYEKDVKANKRGLQAHFTKMFPRYGKVFIGELSAWPQLTGSSKGTTSGKGSAFS